MIQFKKFTKAQAKEFADEIDKLSPAAFEDRQAQWNLMLPTVTCGRVSSIHTNNTKM